jgi:hypothetical protein
MRSDKDVGCKLSQWATVLKDIVKEARKSHEYYCDGNYELTQSAIKKAG